MFPFRLKNEQKLNRRNEERSHCILYFMFQHIFHKRIMCVLFSQLDFLNGKHASGILKSETYIECAFFFGLIKFV